MLYHALERFPGQVQAVEIGIAVFKAGQNTKRLLIVVKTAKFQHRPAKRFFPGMTERGVAKVMREGNRLGEVVIQLQRTRHGPSNLRHLYRMRHPRPEVVTLVIDEDLRLVLQLSEGCGMQNPIPVTLKGRSAAAGRRVGLGRRFFIRPATALRSVTGKHCQIARLDVVAC